MSSTKSMKQKTVGTSVRPSRESERIQETQRKTKEKKVNHKLGIIVPYRDRETQLKDSYLI